MPRKEQTPKKKRPKKKTKEKSPKKSEDPKMDELEAELNRLAAIAEQNLEDRRGITALREEIQVEKKHHTHPTQAIMGNKGEYFTSGGARGC